MTSPVIGLLAGVLMAWLWGRSWKACARSAHWYGWMAGCRSSVAKPL